MIKQFISELEQALVSINTAIEADPELDREELERDVLMVLCEEEYNLLSFNGDNKQ